MRGHTGGEQTGHSVSPRNGSHIRCFWGLLLLADKVVHEMRILARDVIAFFSSLFNQEKVNEVANNNRRRGRNIESLFRGLPPKLQKYKLQSTHSPPSIVLLLDCLETVLMKAHKYNSGLSGGQKQCSGWRSLKWQ